MLLSFVLAEKEREDFIRKYFTLSDSEHKIRRSHLYDDVIKLYQYQPLTEEYPLRIRFEGERAMDYGGVSRDMSGFWEQAYQNVFDGCGLLTPVIHPQIDMQVLPIIGRILSHGYLVANFLPIRIAFPSLACMLLGPTVIIPDSILLDTFPDCLSEYEAGIIRECLGCTAPFGANLEGRVMDVLSWFGCREVPSYCNMRKVIIEVAKYEFVVKLLAAITMMSTGIPHSHAAFWSGKSVEEFHSLYLGLTATSAKIVEIIDCDPADKNEERVLGYLKQYVGSMAQDKVRRFLRFTTGSSVCMTRKISIIFNTLCGFSRRHISHTCSCMLELSSSYVTYLDLVNEFDHVLAQPEVSWCMDGV